MRACQRVFAGWLVWLALAGVVYSASEAGAQAQGGRPARGDSAAVARTDTTRAASDTSTWGALERDGFLVAKTDRGTLYISIYMLERYLNQLPVDQSFVDHLGNLRQIETRNDIQLHRLQFWARGWFWVPKFRYEFQAWSVLSTTQVALVGYFAYLASKPLGLFAGISGIPGVMSLLNIAPYFLGTDRFLADDYFRPGFTSGVWIQGEPAPGLNYKLMLGNSLNQLSITAVQLTRNLASGASVWWMPTTHEFGPRGAGGSGDYEHHDTLATRIGTAYARSRENRFNNVPESSPDNTVIRLSDSLIPFAQGALAPGVTVSNLNYQLASGSLGFKYRGAFLQGDYYQRWLTHFDADGPVPENHIVDKGYQLQASYMAIPKRVEPFVETSQISGAFNYASDVGLGVNYYPGTGRYPKVNAMCLVVRHSPVSSTFGYYVGGQKGATLALSVDMIF